MEMQLRGATIYLTGTIPARGTYVLAYQGTSNSSSAEILAEADQTSATSFYNGDDAILLLQGSVVLDRIGQVGSDPGTQWTGSIPTTPTTTTLDRTLVRKPSVSSGDTATGDAFDPSLQWNSFAVDTFTYLGSHDITSYTVTYSPGDHGTFSTQSTNDLIMGSPTPAAPVTNGDPGWTFAGWDSVPTATVTCTITYTATWTQEVYSVTYNPGRKGTFTIQTSTPLYYGDITPLEPTITGQTNWVFSGWVPVRSLTVTKTVTYVAQWTYVLAQGPVVFYHIYGGGGNANGVYSNDFVVLKNIGASPVNLDGWEIQYTSYNGTIWSSVGPLNSSISPDGYYVIKGYQGTNTPPQAELPYFQASFPLLAIDQKQYKMRLVDSTSAVVDFIGSGAADDYLGSGAASLTADTGPAANQQSLIRKTSNSNPYSGNNVYDYTIQSPTDLSYLTSHTVYFNRNTGDTDSVPSELNIRHGETAAYLPAEPVKVDHQFVGWNTADDGSGSVFDLSYSVTSDMEVYAQWIWAPIPQTSDSTHIELWIFLAIIAMAGFIVLERRRRKSTGSDS